MSVPAFRFKVTLGSAVSLVVPRPLFSPLAFPLFVPSSSQPYPLVLYCQPPSLFPLFEPLTLYSPVLTPLRILPPPREVTPRSASRARVNGLAFRWHFLVSRRRPPCPLLLILPFPSSPHPLHSLIPFAPSPCPHSASWPGCTAAAAPIVSLRPLRHYIHSEMKVRSEPLLVLVCCGCFRPFFLSLFDSDFRVGARCLSFGVTS